MQILQDIQEKLGPAKIEVSMPTVFPKEFIFEWTPPEEAKLRHLSPISSRKAKAFDRFDFTALMKYLNTNTAMHSQRSRNASIMNLKRFFTLLEIEEGDFHPVGVLCAIYKQDVLDEMKEAPMLNGQYGWAREMDTALQHYIEHLKIVCNKQQPRCRRSSMGPTSPPMEGCAQPASRP